jgi:hypothetical protein
VKKIIDFIEAGIGFYGAWYTIRYYLGKLNLTEEKEARRLEKVEKLGGLMILLAIALVIMSCVRIIYTLVHWG